jgi:hypothetical protein
MPTFSISPPPGAPLALSGGTGTLSFTITNTAAMSATGSAVIIPTAPTTLDWYAVNGDNTRTFPAGGVESFAITITAPPGTVAGAYGFRLDAKSEANPEEDYTEGPAVQFTVPAAPKKVPWWKKYWWILVIAAVVIIGIVVAILLLGGGPPAPKLETPKNNEVLKVPQGQPFALPVKWDPGSLKNGRFDIEIEQCVKACGDPDNPIRTEQNRPGTFFAVEFAKAVNGRVRVTAVDGGKRSDPSPFHEFSFQEIPSGGGGGVGPNICEKFPGLCTRPLPVFKELQLNTGG